MRASIVSAIIAASFVTLACSVDSLSGPDAQAAFTRARPHVDAYWDKGLIVFVDGQRVTMGDSHYDVDPRTIQRIEIVKGPAAVRLYGDEAKLGVVLIYTNSASAERQAP